MVSRLWKMSMLLAMASLADRLGGEGLLSKTAHAGNVVVTLNSYEWDWSSSLTITGTPDADVITLCQKGENLEVKAGRGTTVNGAKSQSYSMKGITWIGVYTDGGRDDITVRDLTALDCELQVDLGPGADSLTVYKTKLSGLNVWGGDGNDQFSVKDFRVESAYPWWGWHPWDPVYPLVPLPIEGEDGIGGAIVEPTLSRMYGAPGGIRFEGGNGNDTLDAKQGTASSVGFFGGAGNDNCNLNGVTTGTPSYPYDDPPIYLLKSAKNVAAPQDVVMDGDEPQIAICFPAYWRMTGLTFNGDGWSDTDIPPSDKDKLSITYCDVSMADIWGGNGNFTASVFMSTFHDSFYVGSGDGNCLFQSIGSEYNCDVSACGGNGRDRFVSTRDNSDPERLWTSEFESVTIR